MANWTSIDTTVNLGFILLENGDYMLQEDNVSKLKLNFNRNAGSAWTAVSKSA